MTGAQRGFLLLCSSLGDPQRKPLTPAQLRELTRRVGQMPPPEEDRPLAAKDLTALGYSQEEAGRILSLLAQEDVLEYYLEKARKAGCVPVTKADGCYPQELKDRLGGEAPGSLWAKGDLSLLEGQKIALIGSRDLQEDNEAFAREVGYQAARQGYVLLSGNARGADSVAQQAALAAGGAVISVIPGSLAQIPSQSNVLYLAQDHFDAPFHAARALSRNRIIHALAKKVFVAQCTLEKGGTWEGTVRNLKKGYSPVFCLDDGSQGARCLLDMGAVPVTGEELQDFSRLKAAGASLFDA